MDTFAIIALIFLYLAVGTILLTIINFFFGDGDALDFEDDAFIIVILAWPLALIILLVIVAVPACTVGVSELTCHICQKIEAFVENLKKKGE